MNEKLVKGWDYLRRTIGIPVMIVILVTGSYFVYTFIRDWQTRHAVELQNDRIEKYAKQSEAALAETNSHLADFAKNNEVTQELFETIRTMSGRKAITVMIAPSWF